MNILILSASTGGGHNRAASALKSTINETDPSTHVDIIDVFKECSALVNNTVVMGYKALVTLTPALFGAIYKSADKKSALSDTVNVLYQQCAKKLQPIIEEYHPDAVISCHPFAGGIMAYIKTKNGYRVPLISIVTDFLPHRTYVNDGIDAYITASDTAKYILTEQYGVDPKCIYDYGHPIFEKFYEGNGRKREEVLAELGFDPEKRTVLLMAGSFGVNDILEIYENLLKINLDYQIIVITGKNQKLYDAFVEMINSEQEIVTPDEPDFIKSLSEDSVIRFIYNTSEDVADRITSTFRRSAVGSKPTRLFYFVDNVDDYMHAADLIITKPGGLTTSESIACALPMVVFKAYPGQEEQNAALLEANDIAVILRDSSETVDTVGSLLKNDEQLKKMRESCRSYVRKHSSRNIYELAKSLVEKEKESS